jgi:hypothetical protein
MIEVDIWFYLLVVIIFLWLAKHFIRVYKRNEIVKKIRGPGLPWLLGGMTIPLFHRFFVKGKEGLHSLMNDSVKYSEDYGSNLYVA